jgi:hypothetical protein
MTLNLNLPPDLAEQLNRDAERHGLSPDKFTLQILEQHPVPGKQSGELVALLQSWIDDEDIAGQQETGEYLIRALDEDRPSERKLFRPELEGITW